MVNTARRVVTDRGGGSSAAPYDSFNLGDHVGDDPAAVAANRARLASSLGVPGDRVVFAAPVHGTVVRRVQGPQRLPPEVDGLLTTETGLVLVALAADCVPVLLAEHTVGVVAAVHAGREGVRRDIASAAVRAMTALGARADRIDVLMGPAICGRCYEVPQQVRRDVDRSAPGSATTTRRGTPGLDLRAGIAAQLANVGVTQIVADPRCTYENPGLFSHRRDGVTGRQAGVVWLE